MVDSNRHIDLVICDINMPVMNGLEMVEKVKGKPENKSLPIVMLTTRRNLAGEARKGSGCDRWIVKPFKPSAWSRRLSI